MQQLACRRCGASLKVPEALTAVVVTCQFCGESTPLPNDLLAVRQAQHRAVTMQQAQQQAVRQNQEAQKQVVRGIGWMLFLFIGVPILLVVGIAIFIIWVVHDATKNIQHTTTTPHEISTPTPTVAPRAIASDSKSTGEDKTTAEMKDLYAKGCKSVTMAPKQVQGEKTLKTNFVVGGPCIRLLANTGVPDNKLTLTMQNPLGETIKTPEPTTEIDFMFCPKIAGEHPMTITPATDDYFTLAAVDCPASVKPKSSH